MTNNPNKTLTIERSWKAEAKRRFKRLNERMLQIPLVSITTNVSDAQRAEIERFILQFELLAKQEILNSPWQSKYQTAAYERGIERVNASMKNAFRNPPSEFFGITHAPATVSLALPQNLNELQFLHARANTALEKWVVALLEDSRNILHEQLGIVSVDDIHEAIAERINVTTSYANRIAATEVAQASQRSVIKQTQELQIVSEEELEVLWITVDDTHVRKLHANWHKTLMSTEQAARNITISPFNCRCGLKSVVKGSISEAERQAFAKERKQLIAKVSN